MLNFSKQVYIFKITPKEVSLPLLVWQGYFVTLLITEDQEADMKLSCTSRTNLDSQHSYSTLVCVQGDLIVSWAAWGGRRALLLQHVSACSKKFLCLWSYKS